MGRRIFWYLFLLNCIIHFTLTPACVLFSLEILDLGRIGITPYVLNYLDRLFLASILLLILLVISIKKKLYMDFNKVFILFLLTTTLMWDILGNFFGFYDVNGIFGIFWFDDVVHLITPAFLSIGITWYLYYFKNIKKNLSIILGGTISFSLSVLWELYEYWSDILFNTGMVKDGIRDTMMDLTDGLIGILLCMIILGIMIKEARKNNRS